MQIHIQKELIPRFIATSSTFNCSSDGRGRPASRISGVVSTKLNIDSCQYIFIVFTEVLFLLCSNLYFLRRTEMQIRKFMYDQRYIVN